MDTNTIYRYVERLSELLRVDLRQAGARQNLQPVQIEVLHYLSMCNRYSDTPMSVTEYLGQTKGTVSQTIKVLESKALLKKQLDENDKRLMHLAITAKGRRVLEQCVPSPVFEQTCESFTALKQVAIAEALKQLMDAVQKNSQMKSFGVCHECRHIQQSEQPYCQLLEQPLTESDIEKICRMFKKDEKVDDI